MDFDVYRSSLNEDGKKVFDQLINFIHRASFDVKEMLFVKNPYFYIPKYEHLKPHHRPSIMLVFFKDHVNIFTQSNSAYETILTMYHFTEKHTMQIYFEDVLDLRLIDLFKDALDLEM